MRGPAVRPNEAASRSVAAGPRAEEAARETFRVLDRRTAGALEALARERAFPEDSPEAAVEWRIAVTRELRGKWSNEILLLLYAFRALRFEEMRRKLGSISGRVLSARLKMLESRGLLQRTVVDDRPPRVEYRLSPDGELLVRLGEPARWFLRLRGTSP